MNLTTGGARTRRVCVGLLLGLAGVTTLYGGSTGSVRLVMPQGSGAGTANGDYVASTNGAALDTYYSYYVEVPSGLSRLRIQLFDADIGTNSDGNENANGTAGRDRSRGGSFNTQAAYTLVDPSGTIRPTLFDGGGRGAPATTAISGGTNPDDNWVSFFDTNATAFPPTLVGVGTDVDAGNVTSLTVPYVSGNGTSDLLIAVISHDGTGNYTTPSGWTSVDEGNCAGNACRMVIYRRTAPSASAGTETFTWANGQEAVGAIYRFINVNGTPLDVAVATATGNNDTPTAPSVSTVTANTSILRFYAADTSTADGNPYPTGTVGRFNLASSGTDGDAVTAGGAVSTKVATGATGTAAFAIANDQNWRAATLAIRPAAGTQAVANGHWEIRVNQSTQLTTGDDLNGLGIRADDGTESASGTELNVYYETNNQIGVHSQETAGDTKLYTFYPYVTLGCTMSENDFDNDNGNGTYNGTPTPLSALSSRSATPVFTQTFATASLSTDDSWARNTTGQFTTNGDAIDYGIWKSEERINTYDNNAGTNGNYATIWFGSSSAPANPPTSNQVTGGYRVYFPTDAINAAGTPTAPVKTYLEQQVRCINSNGGVCPALTTNGAARTYQVTVRLVNPEAQSVAFGGTPNVITAVVPGTPVTYVAGSAAVTAGGSVSTNTVGTTTTITWNPGTVAAGATVILTYRVLVTPNASTTYAVTGTGATGTTGLFFDHTGNTTQARAKTTLGPLCVLQVGTAITTPAVVTDVRAEEADGGVALSWNTASEVGTTSFDVLRYDNEVKRFVKVNARPLTALVGAPQGGAYRFLDAGAPAGPWVRYAILEHESDGGVRKHGPYRLAVERGREAQALTAAAEGAEWSGRARALTAAPVPVVATTLAQRAGGTKNTSVRGVAIKVTRTGVYALSAQDIAWTIGWPLDALRKAIASHTLRLTNRDAEVGWLAGPGYDSIRFYGQASTSPFANENVYRLEYNPGWVPPAEVDLSASPAADGSFRSDVHAEPQLFAAPVAATDPRGDIFYWKFVVAGDPSYGRASADFDLPAAVGGAHLRVKLRGATSTGVDGEHHARVALNDTPLGDVTWTGLADAVLEVDAPAAAVRSGTNRLTIDGLLDGAATQSIFYLDAVDASYDRAFTADRDGLLFRGNGQPSVTVSGLSSPDVTVWDVTDPTHPAPVRGAVDLRRVGSTLSLAASPAAQYLAFTPSAVLAPDAFTPFFRSTLLDAGRGADEVIVVPSSLASAVQALADHRRAQGLAVEVVTLDEIWSAFGYGMTDPEAIHAFLAATQTTWQPAPRYVLLAGAGTYDYRNYLHLNGNLVPPLLATSEKGLFADDAAFGDFDGDGLPEIEIGRIPATSKADLTTAIAKIIAYENAASPSWAGVALLAADADADTDFTSDSEQMAAFLGSNYTINRFELRTEPIDSAKPRFLAAIDEGAGLLNYVGHGALDRFSALGLLTSGDVDTLTNAGSTPIVTAFTCLINRFEVPGFAPLGGRLLSRANGGAVAVLAPSGLSYRDFGRALGESFYRSFGSDGLRLGDVVHQARLALRAGAAAVDETAYYNLLGDPALRIQRAPVQSGSGSSSGTTE